MSYFDPFLWADSSQPSNPLLWVLKQSSGGCHATPRWRVCKHIIPRCFFFPEVSPPLSNVHHPYGPHLFSPNRTLLRYLPACRWHPFVDDAFALSSRMGGRFCIAEICHKPINFSLTLILDSVYFSECKVYSGEPAIVICISNPLVLNLECLTVLSFHTSPHSQPSLGFSSLSPRLTTGLVYKPSPVTSYLSLEFNFPHQISYVFGYLIALQYLNFAQNHPTSLRSIWLKI